MTPAVNSAKKHKIAFSLHQYQHEASPASFGEEATEKLAVAPEKIFKTLVVSTQDKQLAVAIVPVSRQLDLKAMAKALRCKKVTLADKAQVEKSTGYVLGGVSPLGQKKSLFTVIDKSSEAFATIFISGGKRGLEIELAPKDLANLTRGVFFPIATEDESQNPESQNQ
ncbi:Cys-tRNA(Pro) deacylase [Thalassomonas viridans]|uniref:Cys-tRNA(Pro)/Cys-tRNA(Cys) deacylase n=1 Tax=Thalassomonas viridans TaxID=137584 RepID=A0AAE9YYX9_9GAMM|nr:Cys-tRNA(Pro) deacylase [Thalassomonas viridans]WDE02990.1 Cys-tRNA(Pro) deacylase [Thalassomonas viridans]